MVLYVMTKANYYFRTSTNNETVGKTSLKQRTVDILDSMCTNQINY